MSKFTPGPWNIHPDEALIASNVNSIQFVAMLGDGINDFGNGWDDPCMTDEVRANARLISAAPDMCEALAKAVADYGKPGGPWNVPSEPGTWIEMAKQALAKADGK